jgi:hypothetical protein
MAFYPRTASGSLMHTGFSQGEPPQGLNLKQTKTTTPPGKRVYAIFGLLALAVVGCARERPPDGHIVVKNDSQDRSYNVITVSGGGAYASLKPGERLTLPLGIKSFSVQRRYKDYTRSYSVECPPLKGKGVFIKLIDIHVNRIAGRCKTTSASKH